MHKCSQVANSVAELVILTICFAMNENVLLRVLADQQAEVAGYNHKKWTARYEETLFEWDSNLAQVVIGVRRSGKSTLCHKVLMEHRVEYGYVNFDDDRLSALTTADLDMVLECIYRLYGSEIKYMFFDEIQNIDGWHLFANRLLRQGLHVFLTGSNAKLLSSELATHLTGRYSEIRLYPLSYIERCHAAGIDTKALTTKAEAMRKNALQDYLNEGGMPELLTIHKPQNRRTYVEGLIETIIGKDIAQRYKIRNPVALRRMAHHLINNSCQAIHYPTLAEISGVNSLATAQKYVSYLSQAFLVHRLQKFSFKSRERITEEKSYVIDTGFIANRDNALLGENHGRRLENAVLIELLRRYHSAAEDIYYYKPTSRSKEVDFVVCRQGKVIELIQVSYTLADAKTMRRETEALLQAAPKLQCDKLTIVCFDENRDIEAQGYTISIRSAVEWLG